MMQHNVWCVCVRSVWRGMPDCSPAHLLCLEQYGYDLQKLIFTVFYERISIKHRVQKKA